MALHKHVRRLFHELADLRPAQRERILAERGVPDDVRLEVESLLHEDAKESLLTSAVSAVAEEMADAAIPESCGAYRLIRKLGQGGMGTVFLAVRNDDSLTQMAAVKLLHAQRSSWIERFRNERQLLASLQHPSIVHVLDAGVTEGRPYLAMEYVEGESIDLYLRGRSLRDKLELMLRVCAAVSHAHQRLIIHRDLKPSNILVDRQGQPKLLDFGLAKLLDASADTTATVERLLTPNYASPEQIAGLEQRTSSDIYSLGAVLYCLVTGRSPHEDPAGRSRAYEIAHGRVSIRPARDIDPRVPGDVDAILSKALRLEPDERYATVDALMNDMQAFLDGRPVSARSGAWYRARKFVRRNWLVLTAAALVVASLSGGLYFTNRERAIAQRRFNDVRDLANRLFLIDRQVLVLQGNTRARQFIVDTSLEYLNRLAADARTDPDLALDVGTAYMRVGRVQGIPIASNLGQPEKAEASLRIAERLIASVLRSDPNNHMAHLRAAQIAHDRMILAENRDPDTEALPLARQSEAWLNKYLAGGNIDALEKQQVVIAGINIAGWYSRKYLTGDSLRLLRRTIETAKALGLPAQAGAANINVAKTLRSMGDLDGALNAIREGVRLLEPVMQSGNPSSATVYTNALMTEGEILGSARGISMGRQSEAVQPLQQAYDIMLRIARQDPADTSIQFAVVNRGRKLADLVRQSDSVRALAIYDQILAILRPLGARREARLNEARILAESTYPLRQLGRGAEASKRLDAAFARLQEQKVYPREQLEGGSEALEVLCAGADLESADDRVLQGIHRYQEALAKLIPSIRPQDHLDDAAELSEMYLALSKLQRQLAQHDAAAATDAKRLALWQHWDARLPNNDFVTRQLSSASLPSKNLR